jgi:hypothetical protein
MFGKGDSTVRAQSETVTLVCAVVAAVALGIACGAWINARLASAASVTHPAPAQLMAAAPSGQTAPAPSGDAETVSVDSHATGAAAGEDTSSNDSDTSSEAQRQHLSATADEKGRPASGIVTTAAREASPSEKPAGAHDKAREAEAETRAARGQGRAGPCALYTSSGALTIGGGGAATFVVGGPGDAGRVTVTTPNWSDIAVFSEGRSGGNGWARYSVRSISKRAGVYTVRFSTPCGSQNIPVTVTRP